MKQLMLYLAAGLAVALGLGWPLFVIIALLWGLTFTGPGG